MKFFGKVKDIEPKDDPAKTRSPDKVGEGGPRTSTVDVDHPNTGLPELDGSPRLFQLMLFALKEAWNEIARTGEQHPFAAIETVSDAQFIQGFRRERLELAYEEARQALLDAPAEAVRYALSWAGYTTVQGVRYETVMVQGGERGKARGATLGQRYRQRLPDVKFEPIGNPALLGPGDNLLTMSGDPQAAARLVPVFQRITADVDHNKNHENAPSYEFRKCKELILSFGDLDLPYRKELQKKPDTVHVIMGRRAWMTIFKPDAKEVYLVRDTLVPIRANEPFPGFVEDGMIMMGYMPPVPTGEKPPAEVGVVVWWMAEFKITDKEQAKG